MELEAQLSSPKQHCVDTWNKRALARGWATLCDPLCRFSDRKLAAAADLWQKKSDETGQVPFRKDMTVRLLQPYIPQLSIYERVLAEGARVRYRVRLMGTNVVTFTKEMTGHFLDEVIEEPFLPLWYELGATIFAFGGPIRILHRGDSFRKKYIVGESFGAPLQTNDGRTDLIMAVTSFEGFDPWEIVCAQARTQLGV